MTKPRQKKVALCQSAN